MRISDWSSDVCSSDLAAAGSCHRILLGRRLGPAGPRPPDTQLPQPGDDLGPQPAARARAACARRAEQRPDAGGDHRSLPAGRRLLRRTRGDRLLPRRPQGLRRSEEHTSELQSLMRISYAVFCLKKTTIAMMLQQIYDKVI